ncbi:MAG: YqgE/AlgH family protein [Rhodobacteraceae bacterium]|nr:YqgE/AlgH family protein [Paracoccaceae bacterium]
MVVDAKSEYLAGSLLVAMPDMGDSQFTRSVILMLDHSAESAMGVVVNKVAGFMQVGAFTEGGEEPIAESNPMPVHFGGPVGKERAIAIHSADCERYELTKEINGEFLVTTSPDILLDLSRGNGPSRVILALGYAGWGAGQLESELQNNAWLICRGSPDIVFQTDDDDKWEAAIKSLGVDPAALVMTGGTA